MRLKQDTGTQNDSFPSMEKKLNSRWYFFLYTFVFLIIAMLVYFWCYSNGKLLLWCNDGYDQHYKALLYYGRYLREIAIGVITQHQLIIPQWDFNIGEGSDILNVLHYYVIGDPIAFFAVFVPTKYMHWFYSFGCILRLYLAGLAFSILVRGTVKTCVFGVLAGSITYAFCYWAILNSGAHPYFLNPMIYFPLIVFGIEKIIRGERPYLYICILAIAAASNFYFLYSIALLTIVYAVVRIGLFCHWRPRKMFHFLIRIAGLSCVSACMAAMILLPVLIFFLSDSRLATERPFMWVYPLKYYKMLPAIFVSNSTMYWMCMGFSAPTFMAIVSLFMEKRRHTVLKILFIICVVITLFPLGGRFLNGMSYVTNRWCWAFALLCAFILTVQWEELFSLKGPTMKKILVCTVALLLLLVMLDTSRTRASVSAGVFILLSIIVMHQSSDESKGGYRKQLLLLAITMISIVSVSFFHFAPREGNYIRELKKADHFLENSNNNEGEIAKELIGDTTARYSGDIISKNINLLKRISSTQYYWTLTNPYISSFRADMEIKEKDGKFFCYKGYDERSTLVELAAVKYYVSKYEDGRDVPYGYKPVRKTGKQGFYFFENIYPLPIGYCYEQFVTESQWKKYNVAQKQEIQLEAAYTSQTPHNGVPQYQKSIDNHEIPYEIVCNGEGITRVKDGFVTTKGNTSVTINLKSQKQSETYVELKGFDFQPVSALDLYSDDPAVDPEMKYNPEDWSNLSDEERQEMRKEKRYRAPLKRISLQFRPSEGLKKEMKYETGYSSFTSGKHDFIVNMGYHDKEVTSLSIRFPKRGIYKISDINIYSIPMNNYASKVRRLQKDAIQDVIVKTNTIEGKITANRSKLLCMAIPYSEGWRAYIDGKEEQIMLVNGRYLGIPITKGEHRIVFRYKTPFGLEGVIISFLGLMAFAMLIIVFESKQKAKKNGGR